MGCGCEDAETRLAELEDRLNQYEAAAAPFLEGHPLLEIDDADDIALFDSTGLGTDRWVGWAVADGSTYATPTGTFTTRDYRDRFMVGSGLSYSVGDTGGADSVTLSTAQIPAHTHAPTDPGHNHTATQAAHTHAITDLGHNHAAEQVAHDHTGTTSTDGDHNHPPASDPGNGFVSSNNNGVFIAAAGPGIEVDDQDTTAVAGDHSHTLTTNSVQPAVSTDNAFTGISLANSTPAITVNSNTTGITIATTGGGGSHENRPPYSAVLVIQKIY